MGRQEACLCKVEYICSIDFWLNGNGRCGQCSIYIFSVLMNILKKIGVRFLFLAGIFLLANFIYKKTLWEQDLKSSDGKILTDFLNAQDSADVIYLGESSNFAVGV